MSSDHYDLELQNSNQNLYNLQHGFPIYVVLKLIYMCSILTKGSTCRKNKKLRFS